jgi:hypothetical protein
MFLIYAGPRLQGECRHDVPRTGQKKEHIITRTSQKFEMSNKKWTKFQATREKSKEKKMTCKKHPSWNVGPFPELLWKIV